MNRVTYIGWLASQAGGGLTYHWPVTLALVCLAVGAVFRDSLKARLRIGRQCLYLFLPAVGTLLILVLGSVFENQPPLAYLSHVAFGVAVLLSVVAVIVLKRAWLTAISISLCLLWYSFWCWFVSAMSITGDWL